MSKNQSFPIQPLQIDEHGTMRFVPNRIVRYLLDQGPFNLNMLSAHTEFNQQDWTQFAQLIGYSLDGFAELNYVSNVDYLRAEAARRLFHVDLKD